MSDNFDPSDRGECELADAIEHLIDAGHHFPAVEYDHWRLNVNVPGDVEWVEWLFESGNSTPP